MSKPKISIPIIDDAIAGLLKQLFPNVKVYSNPNQQGTDLPAFFIQHMPHSVITKQVGEMYNRKLFTDLVYMDEYNLTDTDDKYLYVAETLDANLELFPVVEDGVTFYMRTLDRTWSVELEALHYKFHLEFRTTISKAEEERMLIIQEFNLKLKEQGNGKK